MTPNEKIFQSILSQLSHVPVDYLQQIDIYLQNLMREIAEKEQNREKILNLAGAWNDMPESGFDDFLDMTKKTKDEMFNREIEL